MRNHLKRTTRSVALATVGVLAVATAAASTATAKAPAKAAAATPTLNWVMGTAPQSLDPGLDYTTQGSEFNSVVYTGLTAYGHGSGTKSTSLVPGLATALPVISGGGKTYSFTLRKNLTFSNGTPVKASDFAYTVERAISVPWGGAGAFITPYIAGAQAYATHKAKSISGISANDATGKIVIHLTQAYGPFANVLAFPALGLVPSGTPLKAEPSTPPPGDGPYMVTNIKPNVSFSVVLNPDWAKQGISSIPSGHVDFNVQISSNVNANAENVLSGKDDIFDWADTISGSLLAQAKKSGNYKQVNLGGSTYYIFLNATKAPFNNVDARQAVETAVLGDEAAFNRLSSGSLAPGCFFLPPGLPGHGVGKCPVGTPDKSGIKAAKALLKKSGLTGTDLNVTVYTEERSPRLQWMEEYQQLLNQIGFKATLKQVNDSNYFTTIGEAKSVDPQTGFADWNWDFPNPIDFYGVLLNGPAIQPTNNENFGQTNDKYINQQVKKLGPTPTTELSKDKAAWQKVESYVEKNAYVAVFGYQTFPFLTSSKVKVNYTNDIYGWDPTGLTVK